MNTHPMLAGVFFGIGGTMFVLGTLAQLSAWYSKNRRKCLSCHKNFKEKESKCKEHPGAFCSASCYKANLAEHLLKAGFSPSEVYNWTGLPGGKA